MTDLPLDFFQKWGHSFEEDENDMVIYRPADYPYPRARGRAALEFCQDGEFVDWRIGPADANVGVSGRWRLEGPSQIRVAFEKEARGLRLFEVVHCDETVLKMRVLRIPA